MDYKTDIKRRLAVLITDIRLSNKKNLQDINVYSEDFVGSLLNLVWGCDLKDLNTYEDTNYPGIDLGDATKSICIQVTSSSTREKLKKTIALYLDTEGMKEKYKDLRFVFLSVDKPSLEKSIKRDDELSFKLEDCLFNVDDLLTEIYKLPFDSVVKVYEWLKEHVRLDEADPKTIEAVILKSYFQRIRNVDIPELQELPLDQSDIDAKKKYFSEFWNTIEKNYFACLDTSLEKKFESVFNTLDESDRERLKRYLKSISISLLLECGNPISAIEAIKKKIIKDLNMNLISEIEVLNFVYYQLYRCRVFPLEVLNAN